VSLITTGIIPAQRAVIRNPFLLIAEPDKAGRYFSAVIVAEQLAERP